ncbi:MAG: ABC transporter permease [Bacteroidales bacterium]|nr:ABC transporter permease [Bacteroidales bacterium]
MLFLKDIWSVFVAELRRIFHDGGVMLLFFLATLLYPLIFYAVYQNEMVWNLPVAVVDESQGVESRRFTHKLNATPEVNVAYKCCTMSEAERLMRQHDVRGIVYFPNDYDSRIAKLETGRVCLFCDMSSFLYYRSVYSAASAVMLDEMKQIELQRCELQGATETDAEGQVTPVSFEDVKLFNAPGGFASFLVPGLLVLVLHQTLFLGIGVLFGTGRERRNTPKKILELIDKSVVRVTLGRAFAYFAIYLPLTFVNLFVLPRLFGYPYIGSVDHLVLFLLPFLLATIFFSTTVATFFRERDAVILVFIFFSLILYFLSGMVWPQCAMPPFWRYFSYIFPSTPAIQGFVRINSMSARLPEVGFEFGLLWAQAVVYFFTTCICLKIAKKRFKAKSEAENDAVKSLPSDVE